MKRSKGQRQRLGEEALPRRKIEKDHRIRQLERTLVAATLASAGRVCISPAAARLPSVWETDPSSANAKDASIEHFGLLRFIRVKEIRTCLEITFHAARILLVKMWQMFSLPSGFREKIGAKRSPLVIMLSY
jgi:hypothetical protein